VELEAFAAGEALPLAEHVAACADCGPYVVALKAEAEAFTRSRTPELFLKQLQRRAEQRPVARPWWRWLGVLVPVAVAMVIVLRGSIPEDDGVTFKGGALRLFVKRGESEPSPLAADARVQAGDALRFSYDAPSDGYLAVFDLDGRESVTVFWPYGEARAGAVKKAQGLLPGSVVLDASPGPEWVVAVFSEKPFDTAAIAAQLRGQSTRPSIGVECKGCVVTSQRLSRP
jgi:hypothetical protein